MQKLNLHKIFWYFFPNFSSLIQLFFVRKVNETTDRNNNIIMEDIEAYFVTAVNVAKDAGKMIMNSFGDREKLIETKQSVADLVTETDKAVEDLVQKKFLEAFPTHSFIGEEGTSSGKRAELTDNPTWIIDPIDGTTNFVHAFPYTAVSIGLAVNKKIVVGVVYNPVTDQLFTAKLGGGSHCNGKQLKVSNTTELSQGLVCQEFGSGRDTELLDTKIKMMRKIIAKAHGIRNMGSAALNMCHVASGCVDAYSEFGIHVWDMAAASLIVTEAGGVVRDTTGGEFNMMSRRVLCAGTEEFLHELSACLDDIPYPHD